MKVIIIIVVLIKYLLNFEGMIVPSFLNWNCWKDFFFCSLTIFPNKLISRHHQFAKEVLGLLSFLPLSPSLQHILLAWPVSSLKSLKRRGLETREVIIAKALNKGGFDTACVVTGANREKWARGGHLPIWLSLIGNLRDDIRSLVFSRPERLTMWNTLMAYHYLRLLFSPVRQWIHF